MHALFNAGYCSLSTKISQPFPFGMRSLDSKWSYMEGRHSGPNKWFYIVESSDVLNLQLSHFKTTEEY